MSILKYKDYVLELSDKGRVANSKKLLFVGNRRQAIRLFVKCCNDKAITHRFREVMNVHRRY
jgi:hypothetical protein